MWPVMSHVEMLDIKVASFLGQPDRSFNEPFGQ